MGENASARMEYFSRICDLEHQLVEVSCCLQVVTRVLYDMNDLDRESDSVIYGVASILDSLASDCDRMVCSQCESK